MTQIDAETQAQFALVMDGIDAAVPELLRTMLDAANKLPYPGATMLEMMTCLAAAAIVVSGKPGHDEAIIRNMTAALPRKVAEARLLHDAPAGHG